MNDATSVLRRSSVWLGFRTWRQALRLDALLYAAAVWGLANRARHVIPCV